MGQKTCKPASKELEEVTDDFIAQVSSWDKENYDKIKSSFQEDLKDYLNKVQKDVDITKTVSGTSSLIGSAMGTVGGILVFTPLAPAGIVIGLVGLGITGTGIMLEGGAGAANYFVNKSVTKKLTTQLKTEAKIDVDTFLKTMERIGRILKQYRDEAKERSTFYDISSICPSSQYAQNNLEETFEKEINGDMDEKQQPVEEQYADVSNGIVTNYMVISWLKKALLEKYGANMPDNIPDQIYDFLAIKSGKSCIKVKEKLQLVELLKSVGSVGNNMRAITQNSMFIGSESFSFLTQAGDDVVGNLVKGGAIVANNTDEAALAANVTSKIGTTTSKVLNGIGIAGGILGIMFSSYSIHKTTKSLRNGSPSERAEFIEKLFLNIESGFSLRDMVESMSRYGTDMLLTS